MNAVALTAYNKFIMIKLYCMFRKGTVWDIDSRFIKQGRIYGYPGRVRVGRGSDEIDQLSSWAGEVT